MISTMIRSRLRGVAAVSRRTLASRLILLLSGLGLVIGAHAPASAQALPDPRPANRRICDVNISIVRGQSFTRNANTDQQTANCTNVAFNDNGGNPTNPLYAEGYAGPNGADTGNDDQYPTFGSTAPVSVGPNGPNGRWGTADNTFNFTYQSGNSSSGTVVDNFLVSVLNSGGRDAARVYYHVTIVPPPPTVTSVAPTAGPVGRSVTITGTNFVNAGSSVAFGGVAASSVTVLSSTEISAVAPANSVGAKAVVVTTGGGSSNGALTYTYYNPPTIAAAFSPTSVVTNASATLTFTLTNPVANQGAISGLSFSSTIPGNLTLSGAATSCGGTATIGGGAISLSGGTALVPGASCTVTASAASATPNTYSITPGAPSSSTPSLTGVAGAAATLTVNAPPPAAPVVTTPANGAVIATATPTYAGTAPANTTVTVTVDGATAGTTTATAGGTFAFVQPTPLAAGSHTVYATASNAGGASPQSNTNTFTVAAPVADAKSVTTPYNTAVAIILTASNDPTSYAVTTAPTRGALSGAAPNLTYTPTAGLSGVDTFRFTATNSAGTSMPATVTITVGAPTITVTGTPPAGTRGAAYTYALTASGGAAPYTFVTSAGGLPPGLTIASSGTISGTPTASGSFPVTFTVTDSSNPTASTQVSYTIVIAAPTLTLSPAAGALTAGTAGAAYSQTFTTSGGTSPYSYTLTGTLPAGLTLSAGGVLSGTPTQGGNFSFSVTATDSSSAGSGGPYAVTNAYTLNIGNATIALAPSTLPNPQIGVAYSQTVTASGGTAPYSYAFTAGTLPTGLSFNNGALSGTPTAAGTFAFTITATDSSSGAGAPFAGSRSYSVTVAAPVLLLSPASGSSLASATGGQAYSQTFTTSGGTAPYSYSLGTGALPSGLSLSSGGVISGTPTTGGTFTFQVRSTDNTTGGGSPFSVVGSYSITVNAPTITLAPATLPDGAVEEAYSRTITASGGSGSFTYAVTASALPAGLTLSSAGVLSGTPTAGGPFNFTITATDSNGFTGSRAYSLAIAAPTIAIAPTTLPSASRNVTYSQTLTASGGTAPYSFALASGSLPTGLTLSAGGVLSGTPTTAANYTFTVRATDSSTGGGPYSGTQSYTVAVSAVPIALSPGALPGATTRTAYSQTITANGGTGPYTFSLTGALPAGFTFSSGGVLSGTTTSTGSFNLSISATDANGNAGTQGYTLVVTAPPITFASTTLPNAMVGVAYSTTVAASGGTGPYSYVVSPGSLPAGLTFASDGTLSGTPTAGGPVNLTVTATDANGNTASQTYALTIAGPAIAIAPATLPAGSTGTAYSQTLSASGGTAPYTFAVTSGTLPTGLTLSSAGALAGTPAAAGDFNFTVSATDSSTGAGPYTSALGYTLTIGQQAQTITFANSGAKRLSDSPVTVTATASSGLPVSFASNSTGVCTVAGNSVTLVQTGTCSITASQAGNANIAAATPVTQDFQVGAATLVATTSQATVSATAGTPINPVRPVTITGGTQPYAYTLSAPLPAGLAFSATTGEISGTPTAGQAATSYAVTVTDASNQTATGSFTLGVAAATLVLTPASLPNGDFQVAYSQQLSTSGGVAPYNYAVTAGALPAGITLTTGGLLAGTPTAFGTFNVSITAIDSATGSGPYSATNAYALTIQPPAMPVAGNVAATVAYNSADNVVSPQLSGGTATTLAIATAPANGTARVAGQTLVYTPRAGFGGTDSFTYTASNAGGSSAPATVTVTVTAPAVIVAPATLPAARQGAAYSQQLSASGGTAPYGFAVTAGALPAGLTLSAGGALSGTPTAAGTANFTVTATDSSTGSGPYRGAQAYQLAVDQPPAPTIQPVPASSTSGTTTATSTPVRIVLSDYVTGDYTDIEITSPPANGTLVLSRGATAASGGIGIRAGPRVVATYTPRQGFAGPDSFSFAAVGPGGRSAPSAVTITVLGAAPVVAPLAATTTQGVPVTVDLTATATGGPFTAARITAITPAGSLNTQLIEGGTAGNRTYRLTITPTLAYSGNATVSFVVSNAFGESAPASVTVAVAARPDPSADSTVNGLSTAQAEATRRFASAQIQNFARRNEQLHNGGNASAGYSQGVNLAGGDAQRQVQRLNEDEFMLATQGRAREVAGAEFANGTLVRPGEGGLVGVAGGRGRAAVPVDGKAAAAGDGDTATTGRKVGSVAIWSGGAITVGTRDRTTERDKLTVTTGGLSSGVDVKLGEGLIVGVGGGYGADKTKVNGGEARVKGDAWSIAGYGSWSPTDGVFIDGVFGGGQLDFDTRRLVAQTNSVARGGRDGRMLFGSLAAGFDRHGGSLDMALYGRIDWLTAELDRYSETGGGIYSLTFGERDLTSVQGVLGGRLGFPLGAATGRLRGEWRHEFNDTGAQSIDYADIVNLRYRTRGDQWLRNAYSLDAGIDFALGGGWRAGAEVGGSAGSGAVAGTGKLELRKEF